MAGLSDADQDRFPVSRFDSRGTYRAGSGVVLRSRSAGGNAWNSGMALILLQGANDGSGTLSRARHFHSADETEEYVAVDARRGPHHASRPRILRLGQAAADAPDTP